MPQEADGFEDFGVAEGELVLFQGGRVDGGVVGGRGEEVGGAEVRALNG